MKIKIIAYLPPDDGISKMIKVDEWKFSSIDAAFSKMIHCANMGWYIQVLEITS